MTGKQNNSIVEIQPNELVQHKNKFKSIAIYKEEQYESTVELINENYKEQMLTLSTSSDSNNANKLYVTAKLAKDPGGVISYEWKVLGVDGITDIINNGSFEKQDDKLTITNQWDIKKFITIQAFAYSNGIYIASSDILTVYEKDTNLISAITVDFSKDHVVIPEGIIDSASIETLTTTAITVYRGEDNITSACKYIWSTKDGSVTNLVNSNQESAGGNVNGIKEFTNDTDELKVIIEIPKITTLEGSITLEKIMPISRGGNIVYSIIPSIGVINITKMNIEQDYTFTMQQLTTAGGATTLKALPAGHSLAWQYINKNGIAIGDKRSIGSPTSGVWTFKYNPNFEGAAGFNIILSDSQGDIVDSEQITFIQDGIDYTGLILAASSQVFSTSDPSTATITLTAQLYGDLVNEMVSWYFGDSTIPDANGSNPYVLEIDKLSGKTSLKVRAEAGNGKYFDTITIYKLNDAITAFFTNELTTFSTDALGIVGSQSNPVAFTSNIKVFQGTTDVTNKITHISLTSTNSLSNVEITPAYPTESNPNIAPSVTVTAKGANFGTSEITSGKFSFMITVDGIGNIPLDLSWIKIPAPNGINNIEEYYQATATNEAPKQYSDVNKKIIDTSWQTTIVAAGQAKEKPYLWNFERIKKDNGDLLRDTDVSLLSSSPRTIVSTTEYYTTNTTGVIPAGATYNNDDTAQTGNSAPKIDMVVWKTVEPTLAQGQYLYNFEVVQYAAVDANNKNLYTWTEPVQIGYAGKNGTDGLSVFITYNDSVIEPPTPTGDGTTNGWHPDATSTSIWMSQKIAANATDGTWGVPVRISGVLTNYDDLYKALEAETKKDGNNQGEKTGIYAFEFEGEQKIGINADVIRSGAIKIGDSPNAKDNKFYADTNPDGNVYIAGWEVNAGSLKDFDDKVSLTPNGTSATVNQTAIDGVVINANNKFAVTKDGVLYATAGKIGNVEITSIASTTDINNIQVGGRNLIKNSDFMYECDSSSDYGTANRTISLVDGYNLQDFVGKAVTFSYYVHCPGARNASNIQHGERFCMHGIIHWTSSTGDKSPKEAYPFADYLDVSVKNTRLEMTVVLTPPDGYDTLSYFGISYQPYAIPAEGNPAIWKIGRPKLEKGNKATDWTPAPEDMMTSNVNSTYSWRFSPTEGAKMWKGAQNDDNKVFEVGASGLSVKGHIEANSGNIGGWNIGATSLTSGTAGTTGSFHMATSDFDANIANRSAADWRLTIGTDFGVTNQGHFYAKAGKIGNLTIGDLEAIPGQVQADIAAASSAASSASSAASDAANSKNLAATSATNASNSASSAASSAGTASSAASSASSAASDAATSASNASDSASQAASSATAASGSATAASNSASSASGAASQAASSAGAASNSASSASGSATKAASSAGAASNSATAASGSASQASASASNAATSATNASNSATQAATSANSAATSAGAASSAASSAKAAQDAAEIAAAQAKQDFNALDKKLIESLTGGKAALGDDYVISPYIGGGYLKITNAQNTVLIDPAGIKKEKNQDNYPIFQVASKGNTVASIDTEGNATFTGEINATEGDIGGWEINKDSIQKGGLALYSGEELTAPSLCTLGYSSAIIQKDLTLEIGTHTIEISVSPYYAVDCNFTETVSPPEGYNFNYFNCSPSNGNILISYNMYKLAGTSTNDREITVTIEYSYEDGMAQIPIRFSAGTESLSNFMVLEDGSLYAQAADITGTIHADGGQIGAFKLEPDGSLSSPYMQITEKNIFLNSESGVKIGNNAVSIGVGQYNNENTALITTEETLPLVIKGVSGGGIKIDSQRGEATNNSVDCQVSIYHRYKPNDTGTVKYNGFDFPFEITHSTAIPTQSVPVTATFWIWFATGVYSNFIVDMSIPPHTKSGYCIINRVSTLGDNTIGVWKTDYNGHQGVFVDSARIRWSSAEFNLNINGTEKHSYGGDIGELADNRRVMYATGYGTENLTNNVLYSLGNFFPDTDNNDRLSCGDAKHPWDSVWTTSGSVNKSDKRAKNSIQTITESYETFYDNLEPVLYKYNNGSSDRLHSGFIAQQVEESLNLANINTKDFAGICIDNSEDALYFLRYSEFIPLNTWQIQKLKARAKQAEETIELQDAYIKKLEERIEKLEQKLL